ncbi:hypothetical protein FRC04_002028 [Tulasnella sp. 424]|nr:hypothetical protein FRC04_002028 [Tulasnella sp. 424]
MLMQSPGQMIKLELKAAADQLAHSQNGSIFSLPTELLLRVVSSLPIGSIRNFMANRSLRVVSLLVEHLEIDLSWLRPGHFPQSQVPPVTQPDGFAALSLVMNIRSLSLEGIADWIWGPDLAKLREVVFNMKLIRIEIPFLRDPHARYACVWPGSSNIEDKWEGDLGEEIRKLLQAQPLLEEFKLTDSSITWTSLYGSLKTSDVPNLKSLQATPNVAVAFLRAAPRLESLNLMITEWDDRLFSEMETNSAAVGPFIRRFTIRVWYYETWLWDNLAKVLALFPGMEELSITINSQTTATDVVPASFYFRRIVSKVFVLLSLRHVEVRFETLHHDTPEIFEVETRSIVELKTACLLLESVIDPGRRLWTFRPDCQNSRGFAPHLVGSLAEETLWSMEDLPDLLKSD